MDFFQQQDQARTETKKLTFLFGVALLIILALVNVVVVFALFKLEGGEQGFWSFLTQLDPIVWIIASISVLVVTSGASLFKHYQLSQGGGIVIAESLGGIRVTSGSTDFYERRLLNIVEEMAISSGMPVPPVYLLEEDGINAFAAGHQPSDAVIGVTRGCITKLNREQLQGVIAHEFSHILNGDMRFNLKLIGLLHGILFISLIGYWILRVSPKNRSRSSKENGNSLALVGFLLMVVGGIGVIFGKLIKAAVSRQREYLADASAVQFTRNPQGISDALKIIGAGAGTRIAHPNREEAAHMFFGSVSEAASDNFATHPPIKDRILRIDPQWDGQTLPLQSDVEKPEEENTQKKVTPAQTMGVLLTTGVALSTPTEMSSEEVQKQAGSTLERLTYEARDPYSARAIVFGLLLSTEPEVRTQQLALIAQVERERFVALVERIEKLSGVLDAAQRLGLIQRAAPTLRQLSPTQYQAFTQLQTALIEADQQLSLFEWCTTALLALYLKPQFEGVERKFKEIKQLGALKSELEVILSYVAYHGHDTVEEAQNVFTGVVARSTLSSLALTYQTPTHSFVLLEQAIAKLRYAVPLIKRELLNALDACVQADGVVVESEAQLMYTISALLEAPRSVQS